MMRVCRSRRAVKMRAEEATSKSAAKGGAKGGKFAGKKMGKDGKPVKGKDGKPIMLTNDAKPHQNEKITANIVDHAEAFAELFQLDAAKFRAVQAQLYEALEVNAYLVSVNEKAKLSSLAFANLGKLTMVPPADNCLWLGPCWCVFCSHVCSCATNLHRVLVCNEAA